MAVGVKTSPEMEETIRELVRAGKTRRQVAVETGVSAYVATRVVRDTPGLEWARVGSGSSGTPEAAAKARGVRSEYARNRRAGLSDRMLDEAERTLDLLKVTVIPRDRQMLSQALASVSKAYSDVTAADAKAAPDLTVVISTIDKFNANAELVAGVLATPRIGLIQE